MSIGKVTIYRPKQYRYENQLDGADNRVADSLDEPGRVLKRLNHPRIIASLDCISLDLHMSSSRSKTGGVIEAYCCLQTASSSSLNIVGKDMLSSNSYNSTRIIASIIGIGQPYLSFAIVLETSRLENAMNRPREGCRDELTLPYSRMLHMNLIVTEILSDKISQRSIELRL